LSKIPVTAPALYFGKREGKELVYFEKVAAFPSDVTIT